MAISDYILPVPNVAGQAFQAYQQGRQVGQQNRQLEAQQALSTDLPAAMSGDEDARGRTIASMAVLDPAQAIAMHSHYSQMDNETLNRKLNVINEAGPILQSAKDDASLGAAKDYLVNQLGMDPHVIGSITMDNLPNMIAMSGKAREALMAHLQAEHMIAQTGLAGAEAKYYGQGKPSQGFRAGPPGPDGQPTWVPIIGGPQDPLSLTGGPTVAAPASAPAAGRPTSGVVDEARPGGPAPGTPLSGRAPVATAKADPSANDHLLSAPPQPLPNPTQDASGKVQPIVAALGSVPNFGKSQAYLEGIADYKIAPPRSSGRNIGATSSVLNAVMQINPNYSDTKYYAGRQAQAAFGTGPLGNTIRSLNVAVSHLDTLKALGDALQNGDVNMINAARQLWTEQFGGAAPTNFDAAKAIVADEIAKGVVGGANAQSDRETLASSILKERSMAQIGGAIDTFERLLGGQLGGLRQQWARTVPGANEGDFDQYFLNSRTRNALSRFSDEKGNGPPGSTPGASGGAPRMMLNGRAIIGKPSGWVFEDTGQAVPQ